MKDKLWSARFICTVGALIIWAYQSCAGAISPEFNCTMIALIINWYFKKEEADSQVDVQKA